jgi:hypothetical protein
LIFLQMIVEAGLGDCHNDEIKRRSCCTHA